MHWFYGVYAVLGVALVVWVGFPTEQRLRARLQDFCKRTLAYVEPDFVGEVFETSRRGSRRAAGILALGLLCGPLADSLGWQIFEYALPALGLFIVLSSLDRLRRAGREFPVPDGRTVVARPRRVSPRDYVAPVVRLCAGVAVTLAVALGVSVWFARADGEVSGLAAGSATTGAAAVLSAGLLASGFAHALCARPEPARDACHLYFLDAWRASMMNGTYFVVCGLAAAFGEFIGLAHGVGWWAELLNILSLAMVAIMLVAVFTAQRDLTFRRRLWGTLPPGSVLMPGQPAPPQAPVPEPSIA